MVVAGGASGRPSKQFVGAILGSVLEAIALGLCTAILCMHVICKRRGQKLPRQSSLDHLQLSAALARLKGSGSDNSGFQSTLDDTDLLFERTHTGQLWLLGQVRFGKVRACHWPCFRLNQTQLNWKYSSSQPKTSSGRLQALRNHVYAVSKFVCKALDVRSSMLLSGVQGQAIQILTNNSEEQQAAFVRETLLIRDLMHPHVVQYLGHMLLDGKERTSAILSSGRT